MYAVFFFLSFGYCVAFTAAIPHLTPILSRHFLLILVARQYEPELFPGLVFRMAEPKVVLLIFVSGKVVLTGAKVRSFSSFFFCCCYVHFQAHLELTACMFSLSRPQSRDDINQAFANIYHVLQQYKK